MVKRLPLSGSETIFSTSPWNRAVNSDNCYDYAIGDYERGRNVKSTPGDRAGISSNGLNFTTCRGLRKRILADNPKTVYALKNANRACSKGHYKIMSFVSPDGDFHFYKQVKGVRYTKQPGDTLTKIAKFLRVPTSTVQRAFRGGGGKKKKSAIVPVNLWAHKQGWGAPPILVDASGKTIVDPRRANRTYPGLDYKTFCCSYCVKTNKAVSGSRSKPGLRVDRSLDRSRARLTSFSNLRPRRFQ